MKKLDNMKLKIDKKVGTIAIISAVALASITSCGKIDKDKNNINKVKVQESTSNYDSGVLDINNDSSIENTVDTFYTKNEAFLEDHGINKDQVRDMIFILNDKYTDDEGKLLIDEDAAQEGYSNICRILGNVGSSILQKIDNINTIEMYPEIGKDIDNSWEIINHPSLIPLIDQNISGGQATAEKLEEFENMRDYEVELMNTTGKYDRETINDFIKKMEISDYNTNQDNMDNINKNGQRYVLAAYKNAALQFAAKANPNTIYLSGYSEIDQNIKINATDEERFLENDIITLTQEGLLDATTVNNIVSEIITYDEMGYTVEEDTLLNKYAITNRELGLIMSYAHYKTTMADHKYQKDMCDEENETILDIQTKRINNSTLNNSKKLTLSSN